MSDKHRSPEYHRNARTIRARVATARSRGLDVTCWRCRGPILPNQPWDVGHVPGALGSALTDLAPEHRHATDRCPGNRAEGGRAGATIRNARRAPITTPPATVTRYPI